MKALTINEVEQVSGGLIGDLICLATAAAGGVIGNLAAQAAYDMLGASPTLTLMDFSYPISRSMFVGIGSIYLAGIGYAFTHPKE